MVTNVWDAAGRWWVVGGTAGTFTYAYPAGSAGTLPISLTLPGGGYVTNAYDALARLTRTELRTSAGALLNAHGYQYNLAHQRTLLGRTNSAYPTWNGYLVAGYDPAGQLTNAWAYKPDGTPVTCEKLSYGYDAAQNLAKRTNNTTVETFTINALNQLTSIPDSTPTYDRRGNLTRQSFPNRRQYSRVTPTGWRSSCTGSCLSDAAPTVSGRQDGALYESRDGCRHSSGVSPQVIRG